MLNYERELLIPLHPAGPSVLIAPGDRLVGFGPKGTASWTEDDAFSGVRLAGYWSSTTFAPTPQFAWIVYTTGEYASFVTKDNNYFVWPVRGGD